jgi:hypothetical protein
MRICRLLWAAVALAALSAPATAERTIEAAAYLDRLQAMWLGQCIGNHACAASGLTEGAWSSPGGIPGNPINWSFASTTTTWIGDDDTDLELMNLPLVTSSGVPSSSQLADNWTQHVRLNSLYVANRQARYLMEHALSPPGTGSQRNNTYWWAIDSQITTESLGAAALGMRQRAADLAAAFGGVTNSGYALHAAQFYAAMYAAAPLESNVETVVAKGLAVVPLTSRTRQAIQDVVDIYTTDKGDGTLDWRAAHQQIYSKLRGAEGKGRYQSWVESTMNVALTTLAILYGQGDFQQTVEIGVLAGYDNDCNPATAGGLIGLMKGLSALPVPPENYPLENFRVNVISNMTPAERLVSAVGAEFRAAAEAEIVRMGGWIENPGPGAIYHLPDDTIRPLLEKPDPAGPAGLVGAVRQAGGTVTVSASIERHDPSLDRSNLDQIVDGITDTSYNGHLPYSTYDGANAQPAGGDWYQLNLDRKAKVDSVVFYEGDFAIRSGFVDPRTDALAGGYFQNLLVEVGRDGIFVPVRGLALSEPLDPYAAYQRIEMTFDPAVGDAVRIRGNAGGINQFTTIVELEAHGSLPTPVAWTPGADTAWENPANWAPAGVPGGQMIAVFSSAAAKRATLEQDEAVLSLDLRTAGWTIEGPGRTLAVGAGGIASAGPGANVMEPRIQLAANAIWTLGPDNTLRLDGGVDGAGHSLTKSGPGAVEMAGATDLGPLSLLGGTFLVSNTASVASVTVGAATLGGTGTITGPVTLTGDSTLTSAAILTVGNTLTVQGLANQISSGTIRTTGDVIIDPGAVFIINGTLGGDTGALVVRGTLMGKGTIGKAVRIEAGGMFSPGSPSTILTLGQVLAAETPQVFAFEIGAPSPDYATPANSTNDVLRLTSATLPFANAAGDTPASLAADTVIDVYFLFSDPPLGEYKAEFFAATDFTDAVAGATRRYWRLDPRGSLLHNGNFFSPLDGSLVDWSVVPETATFGGIEVGGYITQFTVAPEPATLGLLALGVGLALLRRRTC